jgi:uncharacterized protein YqjF (DUF2071 family)
MFREILRTTAHRPWPLPTGPWIMTQTWHNLLFAHWPIDAGLMRALVPPQLMLDTYDGQAWIGIVPFGMRGVRPRLAPSVPGLSAFPELNVRTYVRSAKPENPKPGVYFFGLEAANSIAVTLARRFFYLPYFNAHMRWFDDGRAIHYLSRRTHQHAPPATFLGCYAPTGPVYRSAPGSLDEWLTERYCLYTVDNRGRPRIVEIHHLPWPLQPAMAVLEENTMAAAAGIPLPATPPILHFARRLVMVAWPLGSAESRMERTE